MRNLMPLVFKLFFFSILLTGFNVSLCTARMDAGQTKGWESAESAQIDHWIHDPATFANQKKHVIIDKIFTQENEIYPFKSMDSIFGLALSAKIELNSQNSLVRIILVDQAQHEYLIYEAYPLIVSENQISVKDVCQETCLLESAKPHSIKVELVDATIKLDRLLFIDTATVAKSSLKQQRGDIKAAQDIAKIRKIKSKGVKWTAGETTISQLTYEEKKRLFGRSRVPNLQGAEYYRGGIFEILSDSEALPVEAGESSSLVETFDWRNRHGADDPNSPYYDGDSSGSGWLTPVKRQGCNQCWVFSPVHAVEAFVNLYFNQHLDLDLSEQDVASCSDGNIGCCEGGYIGTALNQIINVGVVDETCFPYSSSCESCGNKCVVPDDLIKIGGIRYPGYEEEDLKRAVIDYGPITCGIRSWWHFMVLVGFDRDPDSGETIWIFKNSWGTAWGENGYGYLKVELSDLYGKHALLTPVTNLTASYEIGCYDLDGDGFYNWGIAPEKPSTCPTSPPEKDCDDSNPTLGPYDANGQCLPIADYCRCDFNPADGDVDGSDVAAYMVDNANIGLADLAVDFGRVNCP